MFDIYYSYGSPGILPIFDATLHQLLNVLVLAKGPNVTLILDCCFPPDPALSMANVRRIQTTSWSSHLVDLQCEHSPADYRGFFTKDLPYVLIVASNLNKHCAESPAGGVFTQDMVSAMRSSWPLSCRELTVLTQRWGAGTLGQITACYGPYLDRLLYTPPKLLPIAKLRVFSSNVDLVPHPVENALFVVSKRRNANVVVHASCQGEGKIQRLDRLTARYGPRLVPFALAKAPQVLNGVARFHHYLNLRPSNHKRSWFQWLFSWRQTDSRSSIEVYHFRKDDEDNDQAWISPNILHNGVALLDNVPNDHLLGLKITNTSDQAMYPYVVYFDTDTYEINELYSPFRDNEGLSPRLLEPHESLIFGRCPNPDPLASESPETALRIVLDENRTEQTAEIIKIILAQKPIVVGYMTQASPMTSGEQRAGKVEVHEEIPGIWRTDTVTFAVPANFRNGGHLNSNSNALPWGLWRRLKQKVGDWTSIFFGGASDGVEAKRAQKSKL